MKKILLSIITLSLLCGCSTEKVKDEVHTVTITDKKKSLTLNYHLSGGKIIKSYKYDKSRKSPDDPNLYHPVLKKKDVIFLGWTNNISSEAKYRFYVKGFTYFEKKKIDYYPVFGKFLVVQKGNQIHLRIENIPFSNYKYYRYALCFNKKKKKEHSLTEPIYFETGVNHIYPPKYWGFKNIKGSITRNAIDYTFELEEKGIFYYTFYVDSDASRYLLDDDLDREEFIPSGPYLEGKITIK